MASTHTQTRTEKYLMASMKNMREAFPTLSMEDFARLQIQTLFGLEREEYLEKVPYDKGNGYYSRSLRSLMKGGIVINVPRTRSGGFTPIAVELFKMNQEQVNDLVLTLYKKGMTSRDIEDVMKQFFGNSVSHTTISELAEQFHAIRLAWEKTPLASLYRVVYCDCVFITVRRGDSYQKEAVYIAYGVTEHNTRELLALSIEPTESATVWKTLFAQMKERGVHSVPLVVADGLAGLEDAVQETWHDAQVQKCVVHKMRAILATIRPKDKQACAEDLKHVFDNFGETATLEKAKEKAEAFIATWEKKYPHIARFFDEKTIDYYFTYIQFPPDVRRLIYTTNSIENVNRAIRKATKNKLSFENPTRLLDYVFVIVKEFEEKHWERKPVHQYGLIHRGETHKS
jgi:putative transposase